MTGSEIITHVEPPDLGWGTRSLTDVPPTQGGNVAPDWRAVAGFPPETKADSGPEAAKAEAPADEDAADEAFRAAWARASMDALAHWYREEGEPGE